MVHRQSASGSQARRALPRRVLTYEGRQFRHRSAPNNTGLSWRAKRCLRNHAAARAIDEAGYCEQSERSELGYHQKRTNIPGPLPPKSHSAGSTRIPNPRWVRWRYTPDQIGKQRQAPCQT